MERKCSLQKRKKNVLPYMSDAIYTRYTCDRHAREVNHTKQNRLSATLTTGRLLNYFLQAFTQSRPYPDRLRSKALRHVHRRVIKSIKKNSIELELFSIKAESLGQESYFCFCTGARWYGTMFFLLFLFNIESISPLGSWLTHLNGRFITAWLQCNSAVVKINIIIHLDNDRTK